MGALLKNTKTTETNLREECCFDLLENRLCFEFVLLFSYLLSERETKDIEAKIKALLLPKNVINSTKFLKYVKIRKEAFYLKNYVFHIFQIFDMLHPFF